MNRKQRKHFDWLVALGFYKAAVIYAAEIILGAELADRIIRP